MRNLILEGRTKTFHAPFIYVVHILSPLCTSDFIIFHRIFSTSSQLQAAGGESLVPAARWALRAATAPAA